MRFKKSVLDACRRFWYYWKMAVVIVDDKVTKADIKKASEDYGDYIKIVIDVADELVVIGGEWHADAEKELIKLGSRQDNIWGGGIDMKVKRIDYNALINIRPKQRNDSMEILNEEVKGIFTKVVKEKFGL